MILGTSRAVRVFAYPDPGDLRKGDDGLYGLVMQGLKHDPPSGDLFLFSNRRRRCCKVLVWDGTGLCVFQKRLECRCGETLHLSQLAAKRCEPCRALRVGRA